MAIIGAVCAFLLKSFGWRGATLVSIGAALSLLLVLFTYFEKIGEIFNTVAELDGAAESVKTILKVLGVGYVSGISSDICRELGENALASVIVTLARIETLLIVSPMLLDVLRLGLEMAE